MSLTVSSSNSLLPIEGSYVLFNRYTTHLGNNVHKIESKCCVNQLFLELIVTEEKIDLIINYFGIPIPYKYSVENFTDSYLDNSNLFCVLLNLAIHCYKSNIPINSLIDNLEYYYNKSSGIGPTVKGERGLAKVTYVANMDNKCVLLYYFFAKKKVSTLPFIEIIDRNDENNRIKIVPSKTTVSHQNVEINLLVTFKIVGLATGLLSIDNITENGMYQDIYEFSRLF